MAGARAGLKEGPGSDKGPGPGPDLMDGPGTGPEKGSRAVSKMDSGADPEKGPEVRAKTDVNTGLGPEV